MTREKYEVNMEKIGTPCYYTNGYLLDSYSKENICREGYFLGLNKNGDPIIVDKVTGIGTGCRIDQINFLAPWFGRWHLYGKYRVDDNPYFIPVSEEDKHDHISVNDCLPLE